MGAVGGTVGLDHGALEYGVPGKGFLEGPENIIPVLLGRRPQRIDQAHAVDDGAGAAHRVTGLLDSRYRPVALGLAHVMGDDDGGAGLGGERGQQSGGEAAGGGIGVHVGMDEGRQRVEHHQLEIADPGDLVADLAEVGGRFRAVRAGGHERDGPAGVGQRHDDQPLRPAEPEPLGVETLEAAVHLGLVVLGGEQDGGAESADRAAEGRGLGAHRDRARPAGGDREREVQRHHALAGIAHGGEDRDDAQGG